MQPLPCARSSEADPPARLPVAQACEVSQGSACDGVFAEPCFGGARVLQMLLEPSGLDESIGDGLGSLYRGFEIEQFSG